MHLALDYENEYALGGGCKEIKEQLEELVGSEEALYFTNAAMQKADAVTKLRLFYEKHT